MGSGQRTSAARSGSACDWIRGSALIIAAAVVTEAYKGAILSSLERAGDWLGTCLLAALLTRAWLDGMSVTPPQAAGKAARIAPVAMAVFTAIGVVVDLVVVPDRRFPQLGRSAWVVTFEKRDLGLKPAPYTVSCESPRGAIQARFETS